MSDNLKEFKKELDKFLTKSTFKDKIRIIILEHTEQQDQKNKELFADKEVEKIIKWIVRISTGTLVTLVFAFVIHQILNVVGLI